MNKGLGRCIEHLLNNGADPKLSNRKFPESLLEAAALRGYYPLVAILLQHKASEIAAEDIYDILSKLFEDKHKLKNHAYYRNHVLCLLLNKLLNIGGNEMLGSKEQNILNGVLCNLNLESDDDEPDDSGNICQILRLGASLTSKTFNKKMIIDCLHPDILSAHFDDCVDNNIFYYNSIIEDQDDKYSEIKTLSFLVNDAKKYKLLRHPLLVHFIHNKWLRIFYFFYFDLFLYTSFLLSIYAYMISAHINHNNSIVNSLFYIFLMLHTLKECTQLVFLYHLKYFLDTSNYLELTVIVSCLITIVHQNEYSMVIAILISTVIFFLLLGQLPVCAKYTIIFGSAKYFLQYAGFYFIQFLSFALVFYIIFPFQTKYADNSSNNNSTDSNFDDPIGEIFKSLFYTLILFTGEFSDRVLEPIRYPVFWQDNYDSFYFLYDNYFEQFTCGVDCCRYGRYAEGRQTI
ncbi:hypothetical protein NQ314_020142 [Rhamnusium bicolor]|uniref:Uncharacterized protein n=1 Tax=Rhamnusium bicolor TaxID=1586634 RepID=A0AAV8WM77_9CUCU|nr:hypothetical protein NQ314_020142 [Rhamnusium bicolor]